MNYCKMPYEQKKIKDFSEYEEIHKFILHGRYHTNLSLYYKLTKQLRELKKQILAYGMPEEILNKIGDY